MLTAHIPDIVPITPEARMNRATHGERAKCMQRLIRLDMPVPVTVSLGFDTVRGIAEGRRPDMAALLAPFDATSLLSVRPSAENADWGGPAAVLNIGMNDQRHLALSDEIGEEAATALYLRFIQSYAVHVAMLDADAVPEAAANDARALGTALEAYEDEAEEPFPQDIRDQLSAVLRAMARAWEGTTARLLRQAQGAPAEAGLGLVIQSMALGLAPGESGSGVIQFIDPETGQRQITGRFKRKGQGRETLREAGANYLTRDPRGASLEEHAPDAFAALIAHGDVARRRLREEMQIKFTLEDGALSIIDATRVQRSSRAHVNVTVALAEDGIIDQAEAVRRVEPAALSELLHRQVAPGAARDVVATGIAASPGAAHGRIVFNAADAQASAARGEPCILVRRETGPEDIRGMHAAAAVLTERGGITSHAAVIGRGFGLPCVVGASGISVRDTQRRVVVEGRTLKEGDIVTVDGTAGEVIAGAAELTKAGLDDSVAKLLSWADAFRDIGVRANADTRAEADSAMRFQADGIGLIRTEHMFFEADRLTIMREMIFADDAEERAAVLERLLPIQRDDYIELFRIMGGRPVCVRLLDPPLHEFLPSDKGGLRDLASALGIPVSRVTERARSLSEYNPMLGLRGVRLGITVPEIYDMQVRAILEAALTTGSRPEIMIPLVTARREVELVRKRIDAVAAAVRAETGHQVDHSLGVMVETPRAALRAGDIAPHTAFLSFGTNDLTQMTYGLSRDDAGRFMSTYVQEGVYQEDPFHRLDIHGVAELLQIGAERGRAARPDVVLSLCGEHGGDPEAIRLCREAGFNYVSCSPFRVPAARLAAAQIALEAADMSRRAPMA
ncbi:MAG: putative PEP-binding protein [Pseudomonadota bacterium]